MTAYECPACAQGMVAMRRGKGRVFPYKQVPELEIKEDFEIPTCDACGEMFISATVAKKLDAHLEERYLQVLTDAAKTAISKLTAHWPQQELEQLLGLSHGYLSKLKRGRKEPSPALVSELLILAHDPAKRITELRQHWRKAAG